MTHTSLKRSAYRVWLSADKAVSRAKSAGGYWEAREKRGAALQALQTAKPQAVTTVSTVITVCPAGKAVVRKVFS